MTDPDFEVVVTRSGAPAVRDRHVGEIMHPVIGPMAEALALYVEPSRLRERLGEQSDTPLVLFDVGLGAGSNARAALHLSESRAGTGRMLHIISFDRTNAALRLAVDAENAPAFGYEGRVAEAAHALLCDGQWQGENSQWTFIAGELPDSMSTDTPDADVVFWDPYSPKSNPSLWTVAAFAALRKRCGPSATVHTYSAATSTRSAMLLAGFAVGIGLPSGAKEQTTAAAMQLGKLERPLGDRWLQRLERSSAPFPPDAPADALQQIELAAQFQSERL